MAIENITLESAADPLGNSQPSKTLIYTDPDTNERVYLGVFVSVHGGGPNNFRIVRGSPSPSSVAGTVLELSDDDRIVVVET